MVVNPQLCRSLPCDAFRDFALASLIRIIPLVLVVHPSVEARTLPEFLELTRRMGDRFPHASAGIGKPSHLTIAMARGLGCGGDVTHVPFGGSSPALPWLVGGQSMPIWEADISAVPFRRHGRLRAIAVAHSERLPILPDVLATAEQGMPELVSATSMSLNRHAATPPDRIRRFPAEVESISPVPRAARADGGVERHGPRRHAEDVSDFRPGRVGAAAGAPCAGNRRDRAASHAAQPASRRAPPACQRRCSARCARRSSPIFSSTSTTSPIAGSFSAITSAPPKMIARCRTTTRP
jgi:hypothetical protein